MNNLSTNNKFKINIIFNNITISFYNQTKKELESKISSSSFQCHQNIHPLYHLTAYLIH